jgi:glutamate synthase (NADPH) small chain
MLISNRFIIMTKKMLQFTNLEKQNPNKRETIKRKKDFKEIYDEFINEKAKDQSSRCSQCGVPFCQIHCPLSNNIPDWLKLSAEGRLKEAYELSQSTNNMPEVCGRICPQDRLCEGNCVIEQSGHGTVTIGSIEKYITDTAWEKGWVKKIKVKKELSYSIGIIGAGPAGMACADELRKLGYQVTIYDRYDRPGGLLIYGIPNFKLEKFVVERRTKLLKDSGIKFIQNFEVGRDKSLKELKAKHDAVLISTGVYKSREIEIPGGNLQNIFPAMDFLTASNKKGLGDKVKLFDDGTLNAEGKNIVVIGGGDTAMDCVRTAVRQKAKSVKCLYRRDKENMPGSTREVNNAVEEGVEFIWLSSPNKFLGNINVTGVEVNKMELGEPDSSGRRSPVTKENSQYKIEADIVIKSLGFDPENIPKLFNAEELSVSKWGTIKINLQTMQTNIDGVFAAGDIVRGASLVVWAIKDGRDAADQIANYIKSKNNKEKAA